MSDTKSRQALRSELERTAAELRTLRDQIRVQLHLGRLDARDEWERLAPILESTLERAKAELSKASLEAVADVTEAARRLSHRPP